MFSRRIATFCLSGAIALSLAACGGQAAEEKAETKEEAKQTEAVEQVKEEDKRQVVGKESADAVEIALTNGLAGDITAMSVRVTGDANYGDNLVPANGKVKANEEVRLFVPKSQKADATYDIRVKVASKDAEVEFLAVPLANATTAKLVESDGVAYVEYTDAKGAKSSTKDAATAAKDAATTTTAEASKQDGNNTQEQSNQGGTSSSSNGSSAQPTSEPASQEQVTEEYTYSEPQQYASAPVEDPAPEPAAAEPEPAPAPEPVYEPVYEPEPAPAPQESAPDQSGDACAGDVVLRY